MQTINESQVLVAAVSDAKFDGRDFHSLSRHDRERYLDRSRLALNAVIFSLDYESYWKGWNDAVDDIISTSWMKRFWYEMKHRKKSLCV